MEELSYAEWRHREETHTGRVEKLVNGHLHRRSRGLSHPVEDFLWVYYRHRPGKLRRWHPGPGVLLQDGAGPSERRHWPHYTAHGDGYLLDVPAFLEARRRLVEEIHQLLAATASRPAVFSCFGLHEWAMVYGLSDNERRHEQLPLRLSQAHTDQVVEQSTIRCSHFDAYRFFTEQARPLNQLHPTRKNRDDQEQPGCLHASMDLYHWAARLSPAVPSELLMDCLEMALRARQLDMQASPYDVTGFGLEAIPVETAAGRSTYVARQREIAEEASMLRSRLITTCERILNDPAAS
ncbi:3-methyladenine DNA glycosylase [Austwickia chelonae]|uniref:3-methyladenine DNA glycosylase n=1 Tax=Austwickia chelonae TaxID=100225 RepID=UPI000E21E70D|nr:3-methyladenine DNA glycosylase [Austwickia chelonae]